MVTQSHSLSNRKKNILVCVCVWQELSRTSVLLRPHIMRNLLDWCFWKQCSQSFWSALENKVTYERIWVQWRYNIRRANSPTITSYISHMAYSEESCTRSSLQMSCSVFCCSADHKETEEALGFQSAQTGKLHSNCKRHLLNPFVSPEEIKNKKSICFAQLLQLMRTPYDTGRCQIMSWGHNCSRCV